MSVIPISTSFVNVSHGPYIQDQFWVNENGFGSSAGGAGVCTLPGLYGQGSTILSATLLTPGTSSVDVFNGTNVVVTANSNLGPTQNSVLYAALGTAVSAPGTGLGRPLKADSWLTLSTTNVPVGATSSAIGLCVKYTTLTVTQPGLSGYTAK